MNSHLAVDGACCCGWGMQLWLGTSMCVGTCSCRLDHEAVDGDLQLWMSYPDVGGGMQSR